MEVLWRGWQWFRVNRTLPADLATPDVIRDLSTYRGWPEQQVYEGVQGAEDFLAVRGSAWDEWEVEIGAMHDVEETVVAIPYQRADPRSAGCRSRRWWPTSGPSATAAGADGHGFRSGEPLKAGGAGGFAVSEADVETPPPKKNHDAVGRGDRDATATSLDPDVVVRADSSRLEQRIMAEGP
jgi:hypothetical protein